MSKIGFPVIFGYRQASKQASKQKVMHEASDVRKEAGPYTLPPVYYMFKGDGNIDIQEL